MQTLPKDVRMKIALDLSPPDLVKFCLSEKKQDREICGSETFWMQKLEKDYPEEFLDFYTRGIPVQNPKGIYMRRFTYISKQIEDFIEEFINRIIGRNLNKYLNKQYREDLFKIFFDIYTEALVPKSDVYDIIEISELRTMINNASDFDEWFDW